MRMSHPSERRSGAINDPGVPPLMGPHFVRERERKKGGERVKEGKKEKRGEEKHGRRRRYGRGEGNG